MQQRCPHIDTLFSGTAAPGCAAALPTPVNKSELRTMEEPSSITVGKTRLIFATVGILLVGVGGWFYYRSRLNDLPPFPPKSVPPIRSMAGILVAPQASSNPSNSAPGEPPASTISAPEKPRVHVERDPMESFRHEVELSALAELSATFPDLQTVLQEQEVNGSSPQDRRVVFQLLNAAKIAPAEQRPAILFAADLVASHLGCDDPRARDGVNSDCARLRTDLSRFNLTLKYDELGAGLYYPRDLLWRIWADYPKTVWGERAFVLLLDRGWDTSFTCEKGGDQTREVIRQGESFLRQHPGSPYRAVVKLLVAEAYASWWSLSNENAGSEMSGYVDPTQFQEGAEDARIKAIAYFEEILQLVPGTELSKFADQVLPPLREHQILDNYRFFCVYD